MGHTVYPNAPSGARLLVLATICLWLAGSACSTAFDRLSDSHASAIGDSVRVLAAAIAEDLATQGPEGWSAHFGEGFFMASDGQIAFQDPAAARDFLTTFDPTVAAMELTWGEIRVEPLGPGLAAFGADYREAITDTAGAVDRFGGYVTGLAANEGDRWRLRHLHWSSPIPTP